VHRIRRTASLVLLVGAGHLASRSVRFGLGRSGRSICSGTALSRRLLLRRRLSRLAIRRLFRLYAPLGLLASFLLAASGGLGLVAFRSTAFLAPLLLFLLSVTLLVGHCQMRVSNGQEDDKRGKRQVEMKKGAIKRQTNRRTRLLRYCAKS